jgi:hypothetical protein
MVQAVRFGDSYSRRDAGTIAPGQQALELGAILVGLLIGIEGSPKPLG